MRTKPGPNVALHKLVRASRERWGYGGRAAVDGNPRTRWDSGAGPTQWIEIDLGAPYDITEIHLLPNQYRPGVTLHRILGKGPGRPGFTALYTFNSQLSDSPLLAYASPGPWRDIQIVRIETTFSPTPVAWKEIEVIAAAK
jgi:hypothetical protein